METRADKARITMLVSGHLREASLAAHGIMEACEVGAKHADREGASDENLRDAREIHARLDALYNFVNGGTEYTKWLAGL